MAKGKKNYDGPFQWNSVFFGQRENELFWKQGINKFPEFYNPQKITKQFQALLTSSIGIATVR